MANPNSQDALLADGGDKPLLSTQQANVADPDAITAVGLTFTWSANDPGVTDGTATIDDGDTVGDDNTAGDALSAVEDQVNKLVADVTSIHAKLVAALAVLEAHGLMADS